MPEVDGVVDSLDLNEVAAGQSHAPRAAVLVAEAHRELDFRDLFALYRSERRRTDGDVGGILPAWLADQYLLGRGPSGWPVLERAVRRGELRPWETPRTYLRRVRSFLRRTGYIRP